MTAFKLVTSTWICMSKNHKLNKFYVINETNGKQNFEKENTKHSIICNKKGI